MVSDALSRRQNRRKFSQLHYTFKPQISQRRDVSFDRCLPYYQYKNHISRAPSVCQPLFVDFLRRVRIEGAAEFLESISKGRQTRVFSRGNATKMGFEIVSWPCSFTITPVRVAPVCPCEAISRRAVHTFDSRRCGRLLWSRDMGCRRYPGSLSGSFRRRLGLWLPGLCTGTSECRL